MVDKIQESIVNEREQKAFNLIKDTKIANFAKLANMLIDLFGLPKAFEKYIKLEREGQIVEIEFPSLQGSIHIALTRDKDKFNARPGKPSNPIATLVINVKREKSAILLGKIIRKKSNVFGILFLAIKLLMRKIKIKGSIRAALSLALIMMVGKNEAFKDK